MRLLALLTLLAASSAMAQTPNPNAVPKDPSQWPQHSRTRPAPVVVTPAPYVGPVGAPSDAVVLFDGRSLDQWRSGDSANLPAKWKLVDGAIQVMPGTGSLTTAKAFGDMQLHIEWMTPTPPKGTDQDRGNSGVFLMSTYEIQVLDSYHSATYPDGQAGAIYGQYPPLVNASRAPGEWQTYDIFFHRPHFDAQGKVTTPARVTVIQNGILVQDDMTILGPTTNGHRTAYSALPDRMPLQLQDHEHPVRYRNIWVRDLGPMP
ncbi:MAG TPA: DUF1080 domain-containing protein [Gemmatimonadales bacterium]|jgi:hypothetical protein